MPLYYCTCGNVFCRCFRLLRGRFRHLFGTVAASTHGYGMTSALFSLLLPHLKCFPAQTLHSDRFTTTEPSIRVRVLYFHPSFRCQYLALRTAENASFAGIIMYWPTSR